MISKKILSNSKFVILLQWREKQVSVNIFFLVNIYCFYHQKTYDRAKQILQCSSIEKKPSKLHAIYNILITDASKSVLSLWHFI